MTGRPAFGVATEVGDGSGCREALEQVLHHWGRIDVVISAVGLSFSRDDDPVRMKRRNLRPELRPDALPVPRPRWSRQPSALRIQPLAGGAGQLIRSTAPKGGVPAYSAPARPRFAVAGCTSPSFRPCRRTDLDLTGAPSTAASSNRPPRRPDGWRGPDRTARPARWLELRTRSQLEASHFSSTPRRPSACLTTTSLLPAHTSRRVLDTPRGASHAPSDPTGRIAVRPARATTMSGPMLVINRAPAQWLRRRRRGSSP